MPDNIEEKLDSPLVVHKKSDASYQEAASEVTMNSTHTDEESSDTATLERHRFRKTKKKSNAPFVILAVIIVVAAVFVALVYTDTIHLIPEETTEETTTRKSYTTKLENEFEDTIIVKGTYIFFEGEEVDGIKGLERCIKYLDEGTKFTVKDEHAESNFFNNDVLPLLSSYKIDYEITHIESSGLMSKNETTTAATTTAATTTTAAAATEAETEAEE